MKSVTVSIGQYSVPIISKVPETLCCLLCSSLLTKPHQGPCGCRFCFDCIADYLRDVSTICPGQTEDCLEVKLNIDRDLRPDILAKREINKMIGKCPLNSCDEECELSAMKDHLTICSTSSVCCNACNDEITRGEYHNHVTNECTEGIVYCDSCHSAMKRSILKEEHQKFEHDNLCVTYADFCPNDCGEIEKVIWADHRRVCSKITVSCPYHTIGCTVNNTAMVAMSNHMTDNGFYHAEMLLKHIDNLNNEIACLNTALAKVANEKGNSVNKHGDEHAKEIQHQNAQISAINNTIRTMKKDSLRISPQLQNHLKQEIASSISNTYSTTIDRMNNEMKEMRMEIESLKSQCENPVTNQLKSQSVESRDMSLDNNHDKIDLALDWKIHHFHQVKDLISPRFFTNSRRGYKMCLSIEKNLSGSLSIYAQLKSGHFDHELEWPFRKCVTIRIVDQEKLGRDYDRCVIFNEKAGNVCDRKYLHESGDFGYSEFIVKEELCQKPYLTKNNVLLIHCFVGELKSS